MMAEDVEIAPNNDPNDNQPKTENERTLSNVKNDGRRFEETTRRNERHILFHFFTMFSISFVFGIILIHLSLWMNSYFQSAFSPPPFQEEVLEMPNAHNPDDSHAPDEAPLWYTSIYTQDPRIGKLFRYRFYYTGEYFNEGENNITVYAHENVSSYFVVK